MQLAVIPRNVASYLLRFKELRPVLTTRWRHEGAFANQSRAEALGAKWCCVDASSETPFVFPQGPGYAENRRWIFHCTQFIS